MPHKTKPFEPAELEDVAKSEEKQYLIICLQGAGFSSWDEPHTLEEVRMKFWDYADNEDMFGDPQYKPYVKDYSVMPDWFTVELIQDLWQVELEELEPASQAI